ncbi:hypothetical protein OSB04_003058 [Centaurea solstitialis]|uniref:Reverse transcriptase zinc-binding domain-containing protein n=1 Tax=Centaurea solstitialis TaxID=347529 RepID=A0AA38WMV8_9ASTR|nr:hypothetical protein OSB04_003058 [Centaurea solstitialis]
MEARRNTLDGSKTQGRSHRRWNTSQQSSPVEYVAAVVTGWGHAGGGQDEGKPSGIRVYSNEKGKPGGSGLFWNNLIPIKLNIFTWRFLIDALPTHFNLSKRGIPLQSLACTVVPSAITVWNLWTICSLVSPIWKKIWAWWDLKSPPLSSVDGFKRVVQQAGSYRRWGKVFLAVCVVASWQIWKWRNSIARDALMLDMAIFILSRVHIILKTKSLDGEGRLHNLESTTSVSETQTPFMTSPPVKLISECFVKPPDGSLSVDANQPIHFTPFEIPLLNINYTQTGNFFHKWVVL